MREFLRDMVRDPAAGGKVSASRVILWWALLQYTAWVWVGLLLDRAVPVDPYILTVLLFGPAIAVAFKRAPVELAKELFGGLAAKAGGAWSGLTGGFRPRSDVLAPESGAGILTREDLAVPDHGPTRPDPDGAA